MEYYRAFGEYNEEWDGTDNRGMPLDNGIYPVAIMAIDPNHNIVATNKDGNDHPIYTSVTLDRSILRLSAFTAGTLSSYSSEELFNFTISNPANVKIKIYPKETTFDTYIDTDTASSTYGEPIARDSSGNIVSAYKTLNYFKTAGDYKASYNGTKDNGDYLLDGLYPVAIMATDDYGRIASNAEGDFYPVWTKMSINRSADTDDASGDSSGEENETGAGPIVALGAPSPDSIIEQFPQSIVLNISDNSPINWSKSYVSVKNSNGENLKGLVQKNDTSVVFWPSVASPAGSYTIDVEARDIYGFNTSKSFVFTVANSPGSFIKTNIKSYPNPGPDSSGKITFGYGGEEDVVIKIYTLTGSLVKTINSPVSTNVTIWACKEDGVAPGLYIYRVENKSGKSVTKKLVIGR
jgi:flagellar hook assembly protein FlgD/methionine-rich copper-binding protein CopC